MKSLKIAAVLGLLLIAAQCVAAEGETKLAMNFKGAEIEAVVKFISELTGKNFILDERVRGTITVISPTEVTPAEAYEVFQAILGVKGFTIVPAGRVLKIMPQADAKQANIETLENASDPGDRVVTRLVTLKNVPAQTVTQIIDQLRSKFGSIVSYEPTNLLIITDSNSNIERLLGIIEAVDVPTPGVELEVVRLRYAEAQAVSGTISQALASTGGKKQAARTGPGMPGGVAVQGDAGGAAKVIADQRTNSLIIIADATAMAEAKNLIASLDVELPSGKGKINVIQLKYANAEAMAAVLNSLTQSASAKGKQVQAGAAQVRAQVPAAPIPAPGAPHPQPVQAAQKADDVAVQFDEPVNITADKATNSLVIVAQPQDFLTLKTVIGKLDVLRPQVLVEAMIIEMSYDKSVSLGVEWRSTASPTIDQPNAVGGTNFGAMSKVAGLATNPFAGPSGMFLAAIDGTVKLGDKTYPNIGALVSALQTRGDVDVLSTPNLLTTDNEEAEIIVSDNIPYKTSTVYDSNGNPRDNFEYRDVGLTLRFTPQINEDNYVKLKLFQESSSVVDRTTGNEIAPSTTKRTAKTTVLVKDGSTVVIGGLIKDRANTSQSMVPCLGDIPVLGTLFKSRTKTGEKTNLMIFLTPHVIRDDAAMTKLTEKKRAEQKEYEKTIKDLRTSVTGLGELTGIGENGETIRLPEKKEEAPK